MFKSPVAIAGLIVTAIGWLVLLFGAGRGTGYGGVVVANIHTMFIAVSAIVTGGFLIVAGAVDQALASKLAVSPGSGGGEGEAASARVRLKAGDEVVSPDKLREELAAARERFNRTYTDPNSR